MPGRFFHDLTDVYEAIIDWPKRLANEGPFYRGLFEPIGVKNVLDAACGTGRHAAMFHSWGLRVEGADISPEMIARARAGFGEAEGLRWTVRGFDQPVERPGSFDAAVCVGNSLALAPDLATVHRALAQMFAAVRAGGLVVVQMLNLWSLPDGPCIWQKCKRANLAQGEVQIAKGVHRCGSQGYVDLLLTDPASGERLFHESLPFLGLEPTDLEQTARQSGAGQVHLFGNYQKQPYDREKSVDLILVAEKGA